MNYQVIDDWFKAELKELMRRYNSKLRSEVIKRGIRRKKERISAGSKIR
ncbi:MAG TPA: hypothetical protein VMR18_00805 [Candidatus Saccharimonadales bacterium]|nr:hypothetical protein [Candidatus Saccharimonadales bacterium]